MTSLASTLTADDALSASRISISSSEASASTSASDDFNDSSFVTANEQNAVDDKVSALKMASSKMDAADLENKENRRATRSSTKGLQEDADEYVDRESFSPQHVAKSLRPSSQSAPVLQVSARRAGIRN